MKISIRWALIIGCLALIWGTQIIIASSTYLSSQKVLIQHAHDIMQNIADLTMEQSQNHMALAQGAAHLTKRLMTSRVVGGDWNNNSVLERYFLDQLAIYPHFAGIYVGMPNGDFFYVSRSDEQSKKGFRTKIITHRSDHRETHLVWRDHHRRLLSKESDPADRYDPRERPWYLKAREEKTLVWTDPYIFFTSQQPGVTVAGPIYNASGQLQAIVGVDIQIDQLSTFISKLRIGKHGRAFMLNNNGDVVAFPDLSKIRISDQEKAGKNRLVTIGELNDALSQEAFRSIQWQRDTKDRLKLNAPQFARFVHNGQAYHAMFTPFKDANWPWVIGVYVPESDYLGSIKANRYYNTLLTLGLSVIATLIGLWFAAGVIRPLAGLEKEALAIKAQDLSSHFDTRSNYKEIQITADAFTSMKAAIHSGEEKYRRIFNNIQDVYYEASLDGMLLEISPSIERVSSYTRKELIGKPIKRLYPESQDRERFLNALIKDGKVTDFEVTMVDKDGSIEHCAITAMLKLNTAGEPDRIISSSRIITDRKKAHMELRRYKDQLEALVKERTHDLEKTNRQLRDQIEARKAKEAELRESEEKYRSIIESMENGYYESDLDGNLTFFNQPLANILGYDVTEMIGLNFRQFMAPQIVNAISQRFEKIARTGRPEKLTRYAAVRKDGSRRTLEATASLITAPSGEAVGFRGVVMDITERRAAEQEKRKLEASLQQIQRLDGIGTLAGGVAHDFNNLLMGIQGNVSLMLLETDADHAFYKKLRSIETCVTSGADLTRQLLGFARGGKYIVKPFNFNKVLENTATMFGRTRKEISIHHKMQLDLWTVMGDQNQIEQVLLNLYINAWQAMPEGGHIYLETSNVALDETVAKPMDIAPGNYVRVSVADTGSGIDESIQQKVFEPFFTTKEIGRGTGLGLASAFGIIKNHDGAIDFHSKPGQGTTFYIYLPASDHKLASAPAAITNLSKGSETILLVDDEKVILDVNKPMLETLGYRVLAAQSGREAIEKFDEAKHQIDMVILDMIMPDLGGGAVFDHIKAAKQDIKVLLSTGYSLTGQAEAIMARGCTGVIQKPFNIEQLSAKIREILKTA
jgi:PAS domain S-box-containing protein